MLVFRIIDAGPSPFIASFVLSKTSATLPNETPSSFSNPICAFENRRRSGHARAREQRRVNAMSGRVRKSHAFPMRKLPDPRLPKRRAIHAGDVDRVPRLSPDRASSTSRSQRGRKRAVSRMIPAARANAGGVAQPALHFVGDARRP